MIEKEGLKVLLNTAERAINNTNNKNIIIAGTAHGGDAMALIEKFPNIYLTVIDSFEGLAKPVDKDGPDAPGAGAHSCGGVNQYIQNFQEMNIRLPDEIHKMWITEENLKVINKRKIAMLFVDLDHYSPVKACLSYFGKTIEEGGIIISHDWGFWKTKGVQKAGFEYAPPNKWKQLRGFGILEINNDTNI